MPMTENQILQMILDELKDVKATVKALPQCHYGEVKEKLEKGEAKFLRIENKLDAKLDKSLFIWACGLPMGFIGLLIGLKKLMIGN